jgi:molecular chaperone DnaK (HSP70)
LVGGATGMLAIGRLLTQLTGVVPEKTVNPDEAVALGCAVKVGMLDGSSLASQSMLLNPMQAAILKALAVRDGKDTYDDNDDDNEDFGDEIFLEGHKLFVSLIEEMLPYQSSM